jgi:hypothetical protein
VLDELLGRDPPPHRMVPRRRAQVLSDGEDLALGSMQIGHRGGDFLGLLTQAQNEVGLGDQPGVAGRPQHVQRALVAKRRSDPLEDPWHRLQVVCQHLGCGAEHLVEQLRAGIEVRDQQFHAGTGVEGVDLPDGLGVEPGATVGEVITRHPGNRRVAQPHRLHRLGHPPWLIPVQLGGAAGVDLAEVATAGALVAADEEGRLPVLPALVDVGTASRLADRVQALPAHKPLEFSKRRPHRGPGPDPGRLALDRGPAVANLQTQQLAVAGIRSSGPRSWGCDAHGCEPTRAEPTQDGAALR